MNDIVLGIYDIIIIHKRIRFVRNRTIFRTTPTRQNHNNIDGSLANALPTENSSKITLSDYVNIHRLF